MGNVRYIKTTKNYFRLHFKIGKETILEYFSKKHYCYDDVVFYKKLLLSL